MPTFLAQFLYPRELRDTPSLSSYINATSGRLAVNRSVSEPHHSQSELKASSSPLASTGVGAVCTTGGVAVGKIFISAI